MADMNTMMPTTIATRKLDNREPRAASKQVGDAPKRLTSIQGRPVRASRCFRARQPAPGGARDSALRPTRCRVHPSRCRPAHSETRALWLVSSADDRARNSSM